MLDSIGTGEGPACLERWASLQAGEDAASHSSGHDLVAEILSWVVLGVVPLLLLGTFLLVHLLPEKIAHDRRHPQAHAIRVLCMLSLVFGGLLWPLAWLWAYSKPVLYRLAYGHDRPEGEGNGHPAASPSGSVTALRSRIEELGAEGVSPEKLRPALREIEELERRMGAGEEGKERN